MSLEENTKSICSQHIVMNDKGISFYSMNEQGNFENCKNEIENDTPDADEKSFANTVATCLIRSSLLSAEMAKKLDEKATENFQNNYIGITDEIEKLKKERDTLKQDIADSILLVGLHHDNNFKFYQKEIVRLNVKCIGYVITIGALIGSFLIFIPFVNFE